MTYIDDWRRDEDSAHGWLVHLGGSQTAATVAASMEVDEQRADEALMRLSWRGLAVYGSRGWVPLAPEVAT